MLHSRIAYPKVRKKDPALREEGMRRRRDGRNAKTRQRAAGFGRSSVIEIVASPERGGVGVGSALV